MIRLVFSGFGGQGVLFMGKVVAQAALLANREVTWIPAYGPEMRGGTANCSVIISDKKIGSPTVGNPDIAIVLNKASYEKFMPKVAKGGTLIVNSSMVPELPEREDIKVIRLPATAIAHEMELDGLANIILLGAMQSLRPALEDEFIIKALEEMAARKTELREVNLKAFIAGKDYATHLTHE